MSLLAHRHLLRALCWLACRGDQDKTSEAASGSIEGEAGAGLLWATSEHQRPAAVQQTAQPVAPQLLWF